MSARTASPPITTVRRDAGSRAPWCSRSPVRLSQKPVGRTATDTCCSFATRANPSRAPSSRTRVPPPVRVGRISSRLVSPPTPWKCSTDSPSPMPYRPRSGGTTAAGARWGTTTPFGSPVDPEVNRTYAGSSGRGSRADAPSGDADGPAAGVQRGRITFSTGGCQPVSAVATASRHPTRRRIPSSRGSGWWASSGTYARPAASTPRIAATSRAEWCATTPTGGWGSAVRGSTAPATRATQAAKVP